MAAGGGRSDSTGGGREREQSKGNVLKEPHSRIAEERTTCRLVKRDVRNNRSCEVRMSSVAD